MPAGSIGEAFITVRFVKADTSALTRSIESEMGATGGRAAQSFSQRWGQGLSSLGSTLTKSITLPVVAGLAVAFHQAEEAVKVGRQTEAVIKSTGGAAHVSAGQVASLGHSLADKVGVDHTAIQSGENLLLTFRSVRNEAGAGNDIFTQTTKVALDMSAALGQDLKSSVIQIGKALQDPVRGLVALRRVGVAFDDQQKAQIKTMVEAGNTMGAQKVILAELKAEFGGSAAAIATPWDHLKVSLKDLAENVGTLLLPALDALSGGVGAVAGEFKDMPDFEKIFLVGGAAIAATAGPVLSLIGKWGQLNEKIAAAGPIGQAAATGLGALAKAGIAVAIAVPAFHAAGKAGVEGAAGGLALVGAGALLGSTFGPVGAIVGGAAGAIAAGVSQITDSGESVDEYRKKFVELAATIDKLAQSQALSTFEKNLGFGDFLGLMQGNVRAIRDELESLGRASPDAAAKVVAGLKAMRDDAGKPIFSEAQAAQLDAVLAHIKTSFVQHAKNADEAAGHNKGLTQSLDEVNKATDDLASAIAAKIPTSGGTFQAFAQNVQSAFGIANPSVQSFVDNLNSTATGVAGWLMNIQALLNQNLPGLASLVQSEGAEIGGKLATEINAATPATRVAWEQQIESGTNALTTGKATADALSQETAGDILANFGQVPGGVAARMSAVPAAVASASPGARAAGTGVGKDAATGLASGSAAMPGTASSAAAGSVNAVIAQTHAAYSAGYGIGQSFDQGLSGGAANYAGQVSSAFAQVVRDAVAAAKIAAGIHSPSKVAALEIGLPLVQGVAVGIHSGREDVHAAFLTAIRSPRLPAVGMAGYGAGESTGTPAGSGWVSGGVHVENMTLQALHPGEVASKVARELAFAARTPGT